MKPSHSIVLLFAVLLCVARADEIEPCEKSKQDLEQALKRRTRIMQGIGLLDQEFQTLTHEDFNEKSNRVADTLSRNRAKKVFFAKKKLETRFAQNDLLIEKLTPSYCLKCRKDVAADATKFCELCTETTSCKSF